MKAIKKFIFFLGVVLSLSAVFAFSGFAAKVTAPQVTSITPVSKTTTEITIEWKTKGKVTGYRIYSYNTKTKKYTRLRTQSKTQYTVRSLEPGESYVLAVRPYLEKDGKSYKGSYFKKTVYTALDTVTGIRQKTTEATRHKLTWNKVKGAESYELRFFDSTSAKYVKIGEVKSNSCTLSHLKSASVYKYKIRAVSVALNGKKLYSAYSSAFSAVTSAPDITGFRQTSTNKSGYTLTWDKAQNAQGYYLYCFSEETGDYERVAILSRNQYKVTEKESAQHDTYMLCSYATVNGKRVFGGSSTLEAATKPESTEVMLEREIITGGTAKLSWKEVQNADGYFIYVSSKPDSGFTLKKEISGAEITSATLKGLGSSKTLYFKVKAYADVENSYITSDYSNTVSALNINI